MSALERYNESGISFIQNLPNEQESVRILSELLEKTNYDHKLKYHINIGCSIAMETIMAAPISFKHKQTILESRVFDKYSGLAPISNYLSSRLSSERLESNFDEELQLIARIALKYKNSCNLLEDHLHSWFEERVGKVTATIGKLSQYVTPKTNEIDLAQIFTLYSVVDWMNSNIRGVTIGPTLELALDLIAEDLYGHRFKLLKATAAALGFLGDENYWVSALPMYTINSVMDLPEL